MKIGIFGGAFNPVHNGHISLCRQCKQIFKLDKIILIPTNLSPHKQNDELIEFSHRMKMLELAIKDEKDFLSNDIEFRQGGVSYTYNTIVQLKQEMTNSELFFIIGSDMLFSFHLWYNYNELLDEVVMLVGARNSDEFERMLDYKKTMFNNTNKINIANIDVVDVCSTEIRDAIKNDNLKDGLINNEVCDYIKANNLYR